MSMGINTERVWGPGWLIGLVLAGAVLAVYAPACGGDFGFINYDDDYYVTDNAHVQKGLTAEGLRGPSPRCTTRTAGTRSPGYRSSWIRNCSAHPPPATTAPTCCCTRPTQCCCSGFLKRLTGAVWRCRCRRAVRPASRTRRGGRVGDGAKDVLSTLFWLLATAAYAWYAERPAVGRYLLLLLLLRAGPDGQAHARDLTGRAAAAGLLALVALAGRSDRHDAVSAGLLAGCWPRNCRLWPW